MPDMQNRAIDALLESSKAMTVLTERLAPLSQIPKAISDEHEHTRECFQNGGKWREKAYLALIAMLIAGVLAFAGIKVAAPGMPSLESVTEAAESP